MNSDRLAPNSPNQQRLIFLDQLGLSGAHHHVAAFVTLMRSPDVEAIRGIVAQVLTSESNETIEIIEFVAGDGKARTDFLERAFVAVDGNSLRFAVVQGIDSVQLLVCAHRVALDTAGCIEVLEAIATLAKRAEGTTDTHDPVAILERRLACAAYFERNNAWLGSKNGAAAIERWRRYLVGIPSGLQLPNDRRRRAQPSYTTNQVSRSLQNGELTQHLQHLTDIEREALMMASFAGVLARYSSQDDIVIGSYRRAANIPAAAIGPLLDVLPVRIDASDDPTLGELRERARIALTQRETDDAVPFGTIADSVALERDTSRHPIMQVTMSDARITHPQIASAAPQVIGASEFDFEVCYLLTPESVQLTGAFATDLFDRETIIDLLAMHERLLEAMVQSPTLRLQSVALLNRDEQRDARSMGTGPEVPVARRCLHDVFAETLQRSPNAAAVTGLGKMLTYVELSDRAHRLAAALRAHGVVRGDLVALATNRDPDLLTAILAIHRCGAAYLPLEPSYPDERLEFMVSDGGARTLVASPNLTNIVGSFDGTVVAIDDTALAEYSAEPNDSAHDPSDLAYVIYTSGSTGRPKGVMIEHHGVVNLMHEMASRPGLQSGQVMVGVTTPAFDLSVPDLFLPMTVGAHLVFADPAISADPKRLSELLDDVDCALMQATPSTWRMLLDYGWAGRASMSVVCGGEGYTSALATPLASRVQALWNFYGPTEATVWCTSAHLPDPCDPLPLGGALPNMAVFVGDSNGVPVPVGVPGELMIAGTGLARGYLHRPELTADRFISIDDPNFSRAYRTGDLVRARRDGSLEFMGRIDHQVKLRGFRIELGEIEQCIAAHAGVREVVVMVRSDNPADPQIVGYVVGDCDPMELRVALGERLPAYMVPSHIVVLDDLPRTPNGKTDRTALPAPTTPLVSTREYVAPRGPVEDVLVAIWQTVLGVARIGINDDFFELGGHSLRLTQVLTRITESFGIDLALRDIYAAPTIAATSDAIAMASLAADPELEALLNELQHP